VELDKDIELNADSVRVDRDYVEYETRDDVYIQTWVSDCAKKRVRWIKSQNQWTGELEYTEKMKWLSPDKEYLRVQHKYVCKHYYRR